MDFAKTFFNVKIFDKITPVSFQHITCWRCTIYKKAFVLQISTCISSNMQTREWNQYGAEFLRTIIEKIYKGRSRSMSCKQKYTSDCAFQWPEQTVQH